MRKIIRYSFPRLLIICVILAGMWKLAESRRGQPDSGPAGSCQAVVSFLDVGQGMATLIESNGHFMLVDGGGRESVETVTACLTQAAVESLDYLVISHYDADHLYGAVAVMEAFDIGQILCPDYEADTQTYRWFAGTAAQLEASGENGEAGQRGDRDNGGILLHPSAGDTFSLGSCTFTVVSPVRTDYADENNLSLGIRLVCGQVSFLMMGDAEIESEYDVCDSGLTLKSTVYLVNHHGSATSTSQQLMKTVRPEYAVISCGQNNEYGHPKESVLLRLEEYNVTVFRTDLQGTITARTDGTHIQWITEENKS